MEKGMASDDEKDVRKMISAQNRKKKKSGGFQSMGNKMRLKMSRVSLFVSDAN